MIESSHQWTKMAYILLNKDGSIPGYTKDEMDHSRDATPREAVTYRNKYKLGDEFYTQLEEQSVKRIENRENKRKEDGKWMVYDKVEYNKAVPVIGKSSRRGLVIKFKKKHKKKQLMDSCKKWEIGLLVIGEDMKKCDHLGI